jgi:predicted GTPase
VRCLTHLLQGVVRQQDLALMQVAIDKGKPVMFAINKTDCIPAEERGAVLRHLIKQLHESISQARPSRLLVGAHRQRHAFAVGRYNNRQLIGFRKQACRNAACFLAQVTVADVRVAMVHRGIDRVLDAAAELHAKANSKHSTQQLNSWLEDWRRAHPPTPGRGTRLK